MKSPVHYWLMDPTGNLTILVETPVPEQDQPFVAAKLMQVEPKAEQVGFLLASEGTDLSLRMAGGEFCGNAAMSAAAYYAMQCGIREGSVRVSVSGIIEPVEVQIALQQNGMWSGTVKMPHPESIRTVTFQNGYRLPVISFPGISHVILEERLPRKDAESYAVQWCRELHADALGLMFLDMKNNVLSPLVYVPAADTLFWESTCASGTTAVGAWIANKKNDISTIRLHQPGGTLSVIATPTDTLWLKGNVTCLHENTVSVER